MMLMKSYVIFSVCSQKSGLKGKKGDGTNNGNIPWQFDLNTYFRLKLKQAPVQPVQHEQLQSTNYLVPALCGIWTILPR